MLSEPLHTFAYFLTLASSLPIDDPIRINKQ